MGVGISGLLIVLGAVVRLMVHATALGLNLQVLGVIVMVVGGIGLLTTLAVWGARRPRVTSSTRTV